MTGPRMTGARAAADTSELGERAAHGLYLENVYARGYRGYLERVLFARESLGRAWLRGYGY